jgi:hypothetical protein
MTLPVIQRSLHRRRNVASVGKTREITRNHDQPSIAAMLEGCELHERLLGRARDRGKWRPDEILQILVLAAQRRSRPCAPAGKAHLGGGIAAAADHHHTDAV